jgi:hypothetical protein
MYLRLIMMVKTSANNGAFWKQKGFAFKAPGSAEGGQTASIKMLLIEQITVVCF